MRAPGEILQLPVLSNTTDQAQKAMQYLDGIFANVPALKKLVISQTSDTISLATKVVIEVRPANFRSIRGGTAIAAICDEVAVWRSQEFANPDVEIFAALRPCLATTHGLLAVISSPYAKKGVLWDNYKKHYGERGDPAILVARAPTRATNPTISEAWVKKQLERDYQRNKAELLSEFRSDVETYVSEENVRACIVENGRVELPPFPNMRGVAFVDAAGGSGRDSMSFAIAFKEKDKAVLALLREARPPFSPSAVVEEFVEVLQRYKIASVTGDRFGGEFVREQFKKRSIKYIETDKSKSQLYKELLPIINTQTCELLDDDRLVAQLCNLECVTARGTGRETIDAPRGMPEDRANVAAGALVLAATGKRVIPISDSLLNLTRRRDPPGAIGGHW